MSVNQEEVKKQAKEIMDNFMQALSEIEVEEEFVLERENSFREQGAGTEVDEEFRQRFLGNAPKISGTAVVANKGEWTK